ncbi:MAG: hypothetical protein H0X02_09860 [Nitrosomonas sp.]|nr:hypothetical protein [Nitrosomonas sp.]
MSFYGREMNNADKSMTLTLEPFKRSELKKVLNRLRADLANAPNEVRELFLNFPKLSAELVSFECGFAAGAVVTVLLKPSQLLLDLGFAIRTGNFDFVVVEHPHGFSCVDSGLVELPILSTLEKLPIRSKE